MKVVVKFLYVDKDCSNRGFLQLTPTNNFHNSLKTLIRKKDYVKNGMYINRGLLSLPSHNIVTRWF